MRENLLIFNQYNLDTLLQIIQNMEFKKYYIIMNDDVFVKLFDLEKLSYDELILTLYQFNKYFEVYVYSNGMKLEFETSFGHVKQLFIEYLLKFKQLFEFLKKEKEIYIIHKNKFDLMIDNKILYNYQLLFDFSYDDNWLYFKKLDNYNGINNLNFTLIVPKEITPYNINSSIDFKQNYVIINHVFYGDDFNIIYGTITSLNSLKKVGLNES
mgnify:CR=1 FL=1